MSYGANGKNDIGEDLSDLTIWEIGLTFAILLVVSTVYLYGLYLRTDIAEKYRKQVVTPDSVTDLLIVGQQQEIDEFGMVDSQLGTVKIPIGLAISKVAVQLTRARFEAERKTALPAAAPAEPKPVAGNETAAPESTAQVVDVAEDEAASEH